MLNPFFKYTYTEEMVTLMVTQKHNGTNSPENL